MHGLGNEAMMFILMVCWCGDSLDQLISCSFEGKCNEFKISIKESKILKKRVVVVNC